MDSVQERCQQRDVDWCCVDTQRVDAWALSTVNCLELGHTAMVA